LHKNTKSCCNIQPCKICGKVRTDCNGFEKKSYTEVIDKIQPLDILLTRTNEASSIFIRSAQARLLGHGEFSHVGIVVDSTIMPIVEAGKGMIPGKKYFYECTMDQNVVDVVSGKLRKGVQVKELGAFFEGYMKFPGAVIVWAKLKDNPLYATPSKLPEIVPKTTAFYNNTIHKDYEIRNLHHLLVAVMQNAPDHQPDQTYFCSELVAGVFQACGLFPACLDCETIAPVELLCNNVSKSPKFYDPIVVDFGTPKQ